MALWKEMGFPWASFSLWSLELVAKVEALQGDYATAHTYYEEGLILARKVDDKEYISIYLEGLAGAVAAQGEPAWAARLWGAAEAVRETIGFPIRPVDRGAYERSVTAARAQLGKKSFTAAWAEGRTMTLEQALAAEGAVTIPSTAPAGLSSVPYIPKASAFPNGLTAREVEVLRLLARGLTSAQIAKELVISLLTVNTHVRSIYSKLGVSSRSAATRYAVEHQLM
jgi:ATP/maltotriose-dependent transcriptional regulator MalT